MERIKIETLLGTKVYLTEADSLSQQFYGIGKDELVLKISLWLLLSDHIMLAGSHIFKSESIGNILKEHPSLLQSGVVVPALREGCQDFFDYVRLKREEGDPHFRGDPYKLEELADFLSQHSRQAVLWTAEPVSEAFRDNLVRDLLDDRSVLRRKLIGVDTSSLREFVQKLGSTSFLTREIVADLATEYLGRKRGVLLKYASILYYLWGAACLESEPVLHAKAFEWGKQKLLASSKDLVRTNEVPLFRGALGEFGISSQVLEKLTIPMILDLRKEETSMLFRDKWHRIVEQAKGGGNISSDVAEYENFREKVMEMLGQAIGSEKKRSRGFGRGRRILSVGSFITSIITGLVTDPAIGLAAFLLQLASFDPLLAALERKLGGTEISLFCTELQRRAFQR
jgi:hypothetical protein